MFIRSIKNGRVLLSAALGGLRTTLAVPEKSYHLVTRWLNHRHTGLHVRVQVVRSNVSGNASFKTDGYLRKLKWREHPYREWFEASSGSL